VLYYLFSQVEPSSSPMGIVVVQVSTYEVNIFDCAETLYHRPSASCNFETVSGITGVCSPNQIVM
jgi:hypothetical protein